MSRIKVRAAVFASGKGSNFKAILDSPLLKDLIDVQLLISDKHCGAMEIAKDHGLDACFMDPDRFSTKEEYDAHVALLLIMYDIDWVFLAGYMRILTKPVLEAFSGRILNIHPSLLPLFPGLHAVRQALKSGLNQTGVTVHYVDEGIDTGPVVLQKDVPILPGDTEETLHARIQETEHTIYPEAIKLAIKGKHMKRALISVFDLLCGASSRHQVITMTFQVLGEIF